MASEFSATPRKEGNWTKLVIFIALYVLLVQSILEWVLVLYLYGNGQVDAKMTPSVVLALVAVCSDQYCACRTFADIFLVVPFHTAGQSTEPGRLAVQQYWWIWDPKDCLAQCVHLCFPIGSDALACDQCRWSSGRCAAGILPSDRNRCDLLESWRELCFPPSICHRISDFNVCCTPNPKYPFPTDHSPAGLLCVPCTVQGSCAIGHMMFRF
jgi:hypothetical protein